jgi:perosamine synthetase
MSGADHFEQIVSAIRSIFREPQKFIPLHAPHFGGNEKRYVLDTLESTFVSSVGAYVNAFEASLATYTKGGYAVATCSGTAALHLALVAAGVNGGDEVITQPLTFVATANAIRHAGAFPAFVDVDLDTMGMAPLSLAAFLAKNAERAHGAYRNKMTGRRIAACVPMHTFGFPMRINEVVEVCGEYGIPVIEDAAESLGSFYLGRHTGTFGLMGTFSFNGNKTVTCGGGGAIVTQNEALARRLKHLSTTAKVPHSWEFVHDEVGYNYRMPNLNAALANAQMEQLEGFVENKRQLSAEYQHLFGKLGIPCTRELADARANYWLNTILFSGEQEKEAFLEYSNKAGVMTRPAWRLMNELAMYRDCPLESCNNARWLEERIVNIPSSVRVAAVA